MAFHTESGLKTLSRISSFKRENVLDRIFTPGCDFRAPPRPGKSLVEFIFTASVSASRQQIIFDVVLTQIAPKSIGGLEGEVILIDTESNFSILDFAVFIEKHLTSLTPNISQANVIEQILNRFHVITARTTTECVLGLWCLRDFLKNVRASLLILDELSTCFGFVPKNEFAITQSVFFDLLRQTLDQYSLHCIVCRQLQDPESEVMTTFAYHPTHRIRFDTMNHQELRIPIKLFEGEAAPPINALYSKFSKS